MPLIHSIEEPGFSLAVWQVTESEEELLHSLHLSIEEQKELSLIRAKASRTEWAACRRLMKSILHTENVFMVKDVFGKPYIEHSSSHISISHSHGYASAIVSETVCGIDVHKLETRIEAIAPKFISVEEWKTVDANERLKAIHLFWSAKETMYKYYGKKQLDFRAHMQILPFILEQEGSVNGIISKNDYRKELEIRYSFEEEYLLSYTLDK